jgi:tetraacyldisaccharide-1-P 4'-kinase
VLDDGFQHLQLHRDLDIVIDSPSRFYREGRAALRDAGIVVPRRLELDVPESLQGKRVFAFAGLADNEQFFASLRAKGLQVERTREFGDHHKYTDKDLAEIRHEARGTERIVTTEKDAVKIDAPDIIPVPASFVFDDAVLARVWEIARKP